jgi:hypothetical protein
MKVLIQSYEIQNMKITELEIKLRSQTIRYEKDLKAIEDRYQSKINEMSKNIYFQNSAKLKTAKNRYIEEEEEINHENVKYFKNSIKRF